MGGFRTFMAEQKERASRWDDDPPPSQHRGTQDEDEDEDGEREDEERQGEGGEEEQAADDEFTMEIMLKMAGVDERLIGWNRELNNFMKK